MARTTVELLAAKRDGHALSREEIQGFVRAFSAGTVADYQMAAFLMAVFFRGLDGDETVALTEAMLHSGRVLSLGAVPGFKVDKHSTGGVGDKVSLCLAPLVAACGVPVPMVSGRGLGHTGGTLDKLEAIPGFRVDQAPEVFERIVAEVGTCMIGQTADIAPADKRIYALRDVTATVECIPLIVASILSKKLAEGIDGLVLDVKVGRGAFMKTLERAEALAEALVGVGTAAGKRVSALLTNMDEPLGLTIGNANETREAFEVLAGSGPADVRACTLLLGAEMLRLAGRVATEEEGTKLLEAAIASGAGVRVMERMVEAQGGDPRVVAAPARLAIAPVRVPVPAPRDGFVTDIDPLALGLASVALGAGRTRAEDAVDPAVGLFLEAPRGTKVRAGQALATIAVHRASDADVILERVRGAFAVGEAAPPPSRLLLARVGG